MMSSEKHDLFRAELGFQHGGALELPGTSVVAATSETEKPSIAESIPSAFGPGELERFAFKAAPKPQPDPVVTLTFKGQKVYS